MQFVHRAVSITGNHGFHVAVPAPGLFIGRPARARIDAMEETGVTVGTSFLVRFRLTVSPAGGQTYAATCADLVPRLAIGQFRPGAEIVVMVDPDDPARVTVRPAEARARADA